MINIFYECSSLISLPDISKWKTNNVTDMSYMFYRCSRLSSLPDISKWKTNNVTICLVNVKYYHHCLTYPNRILIILLI